MKTFSRVYFNCIDVQLTLNCNLNCHYCSRNCAIMNPLGDFFYNTSKLKKDFERIFNFPDSESICSIALLGGEPTLHPDFDEIVKFFYNERKKRNLKFVLVLVTNGILLEKHKDVLKYFDEVSVTDFGIKKVREFVDSKEFDNVVYAEHDHGLKLQLNETKHDVLNNAWVKFLFDFSKYNIFKPYNDCKSIMIYDSYCYYIQNLMSLWEIFPEHRDKFKRYPVDGYNSIKEMNADLVKRDKITNCIFRSPEKWSLEKTKKEDILLQSAKMSKIKPAIVSNFQ